MGLRGIIEPASAGSSQKRESRLSSCLNLTINTIRLECKCGAARDQRTFRCASRALVADGIKKRSRVQLPSAARRRGVRCGSVPAVSPPTLHFSVRRTADRSVPMANAVVPNHFTMDGPDLPAGGNQLSSDRAKKDESTEEAHKARLEL